MPHIISVWWQNSSSWLALNKAQKASIVPLCNFKVKARTIAFVSRPTFQIEWKCENSHEYVFVIFEHCSRLYSMHCSPLNAHSKFNNAKTKLVMWWDGQKTKKKEEYYRWKQFLLNFPLFYDIHHKSETIPVFIHRMKRRKTKTRN